jgi:hypothetical protein
VKNCIKAVSCLLASISLSARRHTLKRLAVIRVSALGIGPDGTVSAHLHGLRLFKILGALFGFEFMGVDEQWIKHFHAHGCLQGDVFAASDRPRFRHECDGDFGTLSSCADAGIPASGVPPIPMCSNSEKYSHEAEILVVRQYIDA